MQTSSLAGALCIKGWSFSDRRIHVHVPGILLYMQEVRYKKKLMPQRVKLHSRSISASSAESYSSSMCFSVSVLYLGYPINKLQNGIIPLIFKM